MMHVNFGNKNSREFLGQTERQNNFPPAREPTLKSASKCGTFASFFDTFDFKAL